MLSDNNNNNNNNHFIYVSNVFSRAQRLYELGRQEIKSTQIKSNQMLVFGETGKPEYPGENLSEQSREPTNSSHVLLLMREANPGHIGGRSVLSQLRQHCSRK